ncbi:MAG: ATP-binding protein [Thermoanaerobacteraceae bacterium]|nr:ATP-binding protein [Thermoanaerobacteraceae bacterium]
MKSRGYISIQWKIVTIYMLLILVAMEITGYYILRSFERYEKDKLLSQLQSQAANLSWTFRDNLKNADINDVGDIYIYQGSELKSIYILDRNGTVITGTDDGVNKILTPAVLSAFKGSASSEENQDTVTGETILSLAWPIKNPDGIVEGSVYLTASTSGINSTLNDVRAILLGATAMAMGITAILGFLLSRTIADPIKDVTNKVESIAAGNFNDRVAVRSNDEIGKLGDMFNYMSDRIVDMLDEIASDKSRDEAILKYMSDGVAAIKRDGTILVVNIAARQFLDRDIHEGDNFFDIIDEYDGQAVADAFEGGGTHEVILNTGKFILNIHTAAFKNEKGETDGYVVVMHDITEQQKLDNMRKEFVANVSHELKTPITTIKSYAETLADCALEDKEVSLKFLEVINKEADRMNRLVRDLLQLSRIDYNQEKWFIEDTSLSELVKNSVDKIRVLAEDKSQKLVFDINENAYTRVDRDRMDQVLLNILSNAIKYTPEGGRIGVGVSKEGEWAVISVKDNGIGIPKEDLPHVFERFYRVDKARSREMGGTGLGLSIAKEIVDAHRGRIVIDSDINTGTEVKIYLPSITM